MPTIYIYIYTKVRLSSSTPFIPLITELTVFVVVGSTVGGALLLVLLIVILCALLMRKFHSTADESRSKLDSIII